MKDIDQREFYTCEAAGYEAKRYGSRYGNLFRQVQREAVVRGLARSVRHARVLDVASGTGQMLPVLATADFVVACDLTPAMLYVARKQNEFSSIAYCIANARNLPYADDTFDCAASSRFLHLFESSQQQQLIAEMARVVAPGGSVIVDFYSADGRRIFAPAFWLYRILLRQRPENDFRVSMATACRMIEACGLHVEHLEGIGNFLLVPFLWLPRSWLFRCMRWCGTAFPVLSEQFMIVARKP